MDIAVKGDIWLRHASIYVRRANELPEDAVSTQTDESGGNNGTIDAPSSLPYVVWTLRRGLSNVSDSFTIEEGLYAAYTKHLRSLEHLEGVSRELEAAIRAILAELHTVFGFDGTTGEKVAASTLQHAEALRIVAQIEDAAASAEAAQRTHDQLAPP